MLTKLGKQRKWHLIARGLVTLTQYSTQYDSELFAAQLQILFYAQHSPDKFRRLWKGFFNLRKCLGYSTPQRPVFPPGQDRWVLPAMVYTGLAGVLYKYLNILARVRYTQHMFIYRSAGTYFGRPVHQHPPSSSRKVSTNWGIWYKTSMLYDIRS